MKNLSKSLGPPDISFAGLQVWLHGRQFPDAEDYWDGNWLNVTAHCGGQGADVWVGGAILHAPDLARWLDALEEMNRTLQGGARLDSNEPELHVELKMEPFGHVTTRVEITPNHLTQRHEFTFELDQTYLKPLLEDCRRAVRRYPVRGVREF
jgi:hypothetical protein